MKINGLTIEFWRNYPYAKLDFDPTINVFYGENAQGKTNLLEAIDYLASAKSHRARYDKELIYLGVDNGFVTGEVTSSGRDITLEARLSRGARRQMYANGVRLKTTAELGEYFRTVLFCPEDLMLLRAGAMERRRFLDRHISQLRPKYALALAEYKKLHEHKTRILRDQDLRPDLVDTLDDFSLRMAQTGAIIIHYRAYFLKRLMDFAPNIHAECAGGKETLGLEYKTVSTVTDIYAPPKVLLGQLLDHQESHRQAELDSRQCLTGPHKDDVAITIDGQGAREFASQGQTRTAALAMKLGAREVFHADNGQWPVLLLDDVLSELDRRRQRFVLEHIHGGQTFITCCDRDEFPSARQFRVAGGKVVG